MKVQNILRIAILSSLLLLAFSSAQAVELVKLPVGATAPDFSLPDQDGKLHKLSDLKGKLVVLEWTNPQCPFVKRHYKKKTMPKTKDAFASKNVVWFAINSSYFASAEEARDHRKRNSLSYPVLLDPKGEVGRKYGARSTPHMFVIDAKGKIAYNGAIDNDPYDERRLDTNYVQAALAALLKNKKPDPSDTKPYGCSVKYK